MARMRYVIKHAEHVAACPKDCALGYYTEMDAVETKAVTVKGVVVAHETTWHPKFEGMRHGHAQQFNTKADADEFMNGVRKPGTEDYGAPESFAGCVVEPNTSEQEPE